jgi:hypothetical protein
LNIVKSFLNQWHGRPILKFYAEVRNLIPPFQPVRTGWKACPTKTKPSP